MPTPSLAGSKLPRMFPTSNWGTNVSSPERTPSGSGGGGHATSSGISSVGSSGASNVSDSLAVASHHHGHGGGGAHLSRKERVAAANAQNQKIAVLEQYIQKFPLKNPTIAPPIANILEGSGDSAVRQRRPYYSTSSPPPHHHPHTVVKFAEKDGVNTTPEKEGVDKHGEGQNNTTTEGEGAPENTEKAHDHDDEPDVEESAKQRAEREISSKRQAREAAKQSYELLRRQKVDSWIQMAERNLRKVRRENETLTAIARLTQANALVNDERYEKALESLKAEAELADELRQAGFGPMMQEFGERIDQIQRNMDKIVVEMNKRTVEELATLRENFEKELEKFNKELEDERNSGLSTKLDWIHKNRELHRAVTEELFVSDDLARAHVVLESLHRKRRLDATLVVEETELLEETVEKTRRQNAALKDKLGTLECELSLAQAKENRVKAALRDDIQDRRHAERLAKDQSGTEFGAAFSSTQRPTSAQSHHTTTGSASSTSQQASRPTSALKRPGTASSNYTSTSSGSTDTAIAAEAQSLFDRISQTISVESRNLQTARHAHVEALKQRTELEVYLKYAILAYQSQLENLHYSVKHGLKADSGGTGVSKNKSYMKPTLSRQTALGVGDSQNNNAFGNGGGGVHKVKKVEPTVFTVEDRQSVVDSLLSLPRVLTLMFDPVAAANRIRKKQQQQMRNRRRSHGTSSRLFQQNRHRDDDEDDELEEQQQKEDDDDEEENSPTNNKKTKTNQRATVDQKLFDDLAKLGVDVVGSQTRFMFHSSPSNTNDPQLQDEEEDNSTQEKIKQSHTNVFGEEHEENDNDDGFLAGAPAPPDEEELWSRWNQWSQEAEREVEKKKKQQQQQKR